MAAAPIAMIGYSKAKSKAMSTRAGQAVNTRVHKASESFHLYKSDFSLVTASNRVSALFRLAGLCFGSVAEMIAVARIGSCPAVHSIVKIPVRPAGKRREAASQNLVSEECIRARLG